jgi:hypothetical protein
VLGLARLRKAGRNLGWVNSFFPDRALKCSDILNFVQHQAGLGLDHPKTRSAALEWEAMVRPERRVVPAGASPVRVSAGAPGSRLQPEGEIRPRRAECQKPLKERGANRRAATISERNSLVKFSAERCSGGSRRSYHGEGDRQHPGRNGCWTSPGWQAAARRDRTAGNRRGPTRQSSRAKTGRIKPDG